MKLIGNLKNEVDKAKSKEDARKFIFEAGIKLTTDELEMVTGGVEEGGSSIEVHNFFNDYTNNGEEAPVDIPAVGRIKI